MTDLALPALAIPRLPEPVEAVAYHDNGAVMERATLVDGKPHGIVEALTPAGLPLRRARYRMGLLEGETVEFDELAQPRLRAQYRSGRLHGELQSYEGGALLFSCQYLLGMMDGEARTWTPEGTLGSLMRYRADLPEGKWEWYDAKGRTIRTAEYRAGVLQGDVLDYRPDGSLRERTPHAAGQPHGEVTSFHPNGKPARKQKFRMGKPVGEPVWYDERGRKTKAPPKSAGELSLWQRAVLRITGKRKG
jgi:antitoxin component YwqK of YwqJK toxin-antitoxin module